MVADDIWGFLGKLSAAYDKAAQAEREEKLRRYNSPEAQAARSERSRKAAATRKAIREAAVRLQEEREAREPTGPACGAMDIVMDAREVFCVLPPRAEYPHDHHEDIDGIRWPYDESEDED